MAGVTEVSTYLASSPLDIGNTDDWIFAIKGTRSVCPAETNSSSKPETERNGERLSIAFFFGFNQDVTVEVLDSCVDVSRGERRKYDAISCHDWTLRRFQGMHDLGTPP